MIVHGITKDSHWIIKENIKKLLIGILSIFKKNVF